jgi:phage shock protein PspC (stress-responsive transcriptional regulator)
MDDHPEGREEPMAQQTEPARTGGPWEPPPPRPRKRLYRRTDDKVIAGVASGLADYFEIDPVLVRIGFVILAIAGGAGIVAYGVMWWMVPPSHVVSGPGEDVIRRLKRAPAWVAVALLVVGGVLLANQLGPRHADLVWGLGLVALGVLLFWNTTGREGREAVPATPVPPTPGASGPVPGAVPPPSAVPYGGAVDPDAPTASFSTTTPLSPEVPPAGGFREPAAGGPPEWLPAPRPARPRRQRSGLGPATFGLALVAVGVAALLDYWGVFDLSLAQYVAIPLTVLAAGLVVGAWAGRARWLALPAALLVPFVLVASLVNVPFKGGYGDRRFAPSDLGHGSATYRLVAGRMTLDLSRLGGQAKDSPTRLHVTASEVAGAMLVILPADVPVHVDARVGAGQTRLLGVRHEGLSIHRQAGQSFARSWIDLDLAISFGKLVVIRSSG